MRSATRGVTGLLWCGLATLGRTQVVDAPTAGGLLAIDSERAAGLTLGSGVSAYPGSPYAAPPVRYCLATHPAGTRRRRARGARD